MSREVDYDNLTPDDLEYLRDRTWLPQPTQEQIDAMLDRMDVPVVPSSQLMGEGDAIVQSTGEPEQTEGEQTVGNDGNGGSSEGGEPAKDDEIIEEPDGYEEKTVAELKELCGGRSLKKSGNHGELVARLREADAAAKG